MNKTIKIKEILATIIILIWTLFFVNELMPSAEPETFYEWVRGLVIMTVLIGATIFWCVILYSRMPKKHSCFTLIDRELVGVIGVVFLLLLIGLWLFTVVCNLIQDYWYVIPVVATMVVCYIVVSAPIVRKFIREDDKEEED